MMRDFDKHFRETGKLPPLPTKYRPTPDGRLVPERKLPILVQVAVLAVILGGLVLLVLSGQQH